MKRKDYIKPFVEICLEEMDSQILAGSPNNSGNTALPNDGDNPMGTDVNDKVKDPTDPDSPPPVDAKGGFFIWDEF